MLAQSTVSSVTLFNHVFSSLLLNRALVIIRCMFQACCLLFNKGFFVQNRSQSLTFFQNMLVVFNDTIFVLNAVTKGIISFLSVLSFIPV